MVTAKSQSRSPSHGIRMDGAEVIDRYTLPLPLSGHSREAHGARRGEASGAACGRQCSVTHDLTGELWSGMLGDMEKRYQIILADEQREELERLIARGAAPARRLIHARILLKADQGPKGPAWVDDRIAEAGRER